MHIVIIGAGALGGLVGAQLTAGGEDVTLIEVNEARVKLLAESGIFVSKGTEDEVCIPIKVATSVAGLPVADLVFVSVKSYQTADALRSCLPVVGPIYTCLSPCRKWSWPSGSLLKGLTRRPYNPNQRKLTACQSRGRLQRGAAIAPIFSRRDAERPPT